MMCMAARENGGSCISYARTFLETPRVLSNFGVFDSFDFFWKVQEFLNVFGFNRLIPSVRLQFLDLLTQSTSN